MSDGGAAVNGTGLEPVIGLEIHIQLATATKMFCGCDVSFGDPPNTHTCPVCLGLPGSLPVANARAVHFGLMIGLALGLGARAALDLPPQELLLSRPAQGLPDLPVRRAPVPRRRARRGAHPPRAPRGGRREAHPRRRERAHPRLRRQHRRLQPRRDAARGDRHRARPALGRAGGRVAEAAAHDDANARRQRREHGGGLAALRREHLAAPGRQRGARREDRAEEHELLPLHRTRHPGRGRAPAQDHRGRAARSCRRRCTSTRTPARSPRCAPRRKPTTTATSRSPTSFPSRSTAR